MCQTHRNVQSRVFSGISQICEKCVEFVCLIFFHLLCVTKSVYFVTSSEFLLFNVLVVGSISLNLHAQQPRALCRQNREEGSVTSISCLNLIFSAALLGLLVYNKVGCCIRSISILVMRSSTGVSVVL